MSGLYIISTPIGNFDDITVRSLAVLRSVEGVLCEDTRVTQKLLSHHGISQKLRSYHDHNELERCEQIIHSLKEGTSWALVSDAGTPLISDPGYKIVAACLEANVKVHVLPGPSSLLPALILSGFAPHPFTFCGFFDERKAAYFQFIPSTLLFFESARRLVPTLIVMKSLFPQRRVALVRELTKTYEEVRRSDFDTLISFYESHPCLGECILVLSPLEEAQTSFDDALLEDLMQRHPIKEVSRILSYMSGEKKSHVYDRLIHLKKEGEK